MTTAHLRRAWAVVDLGAVAANVAELIRRAAPAALCAVVKADGYGHGAVPVARAARSAGATWLAVALVEEGLELRRAGLPGPILVLSEPPPEAWPAVVSGRLTPTVYTEEGVRALSAAVAAAPVGSTPAGFPVHVKVDTGMHRVGALPQFLPAVARAVADAPSLFFEGLWTHLAVADQPGPFTALQLSRFAEARSDLEARGLRPALVHAANSAGALLHPAARMDLVRCGISVYGYPPAPEHGGLVSLRPAMSLRARVAAVRHLPAGERVSYGLAYELATPSVIATVPLGYADGVPRGLARAGGQVLIRGRRCPMAGTVTMDQLMVDCGPGADVETGDEVVLIGVQGHEEITAEDWANRMGTISYEILCGVGPRVPREYIGGPQDGLSAVPSHL